MYKIRDIDPNNILQCTFNNCKFTTIRKGAMCKHIKKMHSQSVSTNEDNKNIKTVNLKEIIKDYKTEERQNTNINNTYVNKFEDIEKDKLYKLKKCVKEIQEKNSNNTFELDSLAVLLDKWLESRIMQDKIEIEFISCIKNEIKRQQNNTEEINKILDKNSILLSNIWQKIDEQQQIKLIL